MRQQQHESPESLIRFQQAVIVASRHTIDTFDRKLLEIKERRLALDKEERELQRSFADAPGSIRRAQAEIDKLRTVQSQTNGFHGAARRKLSDVEKKLARRQAILAQLAVINDELGLKNGEDPK